MTWVAQYSTWLPIELMPKGVVFLFFSLYYVLKQLVAAVDVRQVCQAFLHACDTHWTCEC